MRNQRTRAALAVLCSLSLLVGACGDDDDTDTSGDDTEDTSVDDTSVDDTDDDDADGEPASEEMTVLDVTLTDDGLEGVPDEFAGGAVEVSFTLEGSREFASLDFTRVDEGTTADQFADEFAVVFEGGAFPEYVQANAGVETAPGETTTSTILLEPGTHIVWHEGVPGDDPEGAPPEIIATVVEVTEGAVTELPDTDGEITARDYSFDADVSGPGTVTFRNEGPNQHHHAVVVDFGTNSVEVVEEAIKPLLMSEEDDPPPDIEGFDMEQVNFDFASSGVFGPGLGGTFEADFVEGNTYALVCFISDREGGPPHAIGMEMYEVFAV